MTILVMVVTIPLLIGDISGYISFQAGSEIEARALHNLHQGTESIFAFNVSTWFELHARSARFLALLPDIISMDATLQKTYPTGNFRYFNQIYFWFKPLT